MAILSQASTTRQSKITEYDVKLFQEPNERYTALQRLTKIQHIKVTQDVLFLRQQLEATRTK